MKSTSEQLTASPIQGTDFKVIISDLAYQKVIYWVNKSDHEVSGFGPVMFDKDRKTFTITDAFLIKQENGPTTSEIDPAALGKLMYKMKDVEHGLKWWWHSHVDMSVFWSGDDMNCIRGLGQQEWITATVFNKKNEMRSAFYQLTQVMGNQHEIFVDQIPTSTLRYLDKEFFEACDKEYAENVTEKKYQSQYLESGYWENRGAARIWTPDDLMAGYPRDKEKDSSDDSKNKEPGETSSIYSELDPQEQMELSILDEDPIWSDEGLAYSASFGWIYNPIQDKMLPAPSKWQEVVHMTKVEYEYCYKTDPEFRIYMRENSLPSPKDLDRDAYFNK